MVAKGGGEPISEEEAGMKVGRGGSFLGMAVYPPSLGKLNFKV